MQHPATLHDSTLKQGVRLCHFLTATALVSQPGSRKRAKGTKSSAAEECDRSEKLCNAVPRQHGTVVTEKLSEALLESMENCHCLLTVLSSVSVQS